MKRIRLLGISGSLLILAGSVGAQTVFTPGVLRQQWWTTINPSRQQVEQGLAGPPDTDTTDLTLFDIPQTSPNIDNFVNRISGLFVAPATTNYVFFYSSDDDGDLFVSTDATSANKRLVAQEGGWSNNQQWITPGSGSATLKRSDKWSPDGGLTTPFSKGIPLVAGQKYWIESVHHEGGGGDDCGATYKYTGEPDPANGDATRLTGTVIGYGYTIPSSLPVQVQVTNATAYAGREASFTYVVADSLPDPLVYQWYRNGTAIANASFKQYTFITLAADNAAQYQCIVTIPASYNSSISSTSAVATLTVNPASINYTNGLKIENFSGFGRVDAENNNTGPATTIGITGAAGAEGPVNDGILNFSRRMSGRFIPPTSGNYVFFVSSDDDADLFLSTDSTAANKTLIAQENVWSNSRQWTNSGGASLLFMKRSDQFTNLAGATPFSAGIALTAGTPYYIEADSHQGGGGDNLGIFAQVVGAPDPADGTPPIPANELVLTTSPTTTLAWKTQPLNTTVFENSAAVFSAAAVSDGEFTPVYQWYRNGNVITNATGSSFSFTTIIADNGANFSVVSTVPTTSLSITSTVATLTVQQAVFEPGLALMEYWLNKGADLTVPEGGAFGPPDFVMAVPAFEAGVNNENGNTYVNKISGFFVPATSGAWDFITTGDDHNDFFLSTDSNPNNKRLICQQPGWCNALNWTADQGGGPDANQKHSATWTNSAGVAPWANGLQLTAGTKYYVEVWHQEGGGGDSVGVTAVKHGDPDPADGSDSSMAGSMVGFNAPNTATFVAFTNQPVDQTALSGNTATFSAGGVSDGNIVIGTTGLFNTSGDVAGVGAFVKFPNVLFQWYKNGTLIPGATSSKYTTLPLRPADGGQFFAAIRALGIATWSNSVTATLTIIADTNKPSAVAGVFDENGLPVISISFSKTMDLASISAQGNYSVSGGGASIVGIIVDTNDARHVQLQLAAEPTGPITVTFTGITDFSGNSLTSLTASVAANELTNVDIGDPALPDPAWPGSMWSDGAGAYTIQCQGSDIWNSSDGFNFSYESKTNDFDVAVRQVSFTKVSNWSKGGLMVREDLGLTSRNWNIVNDPTSADGVNAIDGSGTGANTVEANCRSTNFQASLGWATGPGTIPAYPNAWVRLKRTGQVLQSFWSSNGVDWVREGLVDVSTNANGPLPAAVYVGICCTAHNNNSTAATVLNYYYTASFANYNSALVVAPPGTNATLKASLSGANLSISWTPAGGTLQSSPTLGAGAVWTPVAGAGNPATIPLSGGGAKFYRVGP